MGAWSGVALIALLITACGSKKEPDDLAGLVPREVSAWKTVGEDQHYNRTTIFTYIDGGAEVYLQYAFRTVFVREFVREGSPRISVQLWDMGIPEDAFGIFSLDREEKDAGIGQDSEYAAGFLRFWKGPYFVSVSAERETPDSQGAVLGLGREIAGRITAQGVHPAVLDGLPPEGLQQRSVRFCHGPYLLAYHYPISDENLFMLNHETDAVLASYSVGAEIARVLIVLYRDEKEAEQAIIRVTKGYKPPMTTGGQVQMSNGRWAGVRRVHRALAAVFEAPSQGQVEEMLGKAVQKLEGAEWAK